VNFVFVSVDGKRDTPDVMRTYLNRFDPAFIGLSGDDATLSKIGKDFGLYYKLNTDEGANYSVDHTTQTYLFNPQGLMTHIFSYDATPDVVIKTIQKVIDASSL
jgi:protein SCO1